MQRPDSYPAIAPAPIDLSALDPDADRDAEARLIRQIMEGRQQSYPLRRDLLLSVWATDRRLMVGAAAIAATMLILVERTTRPAAQRPTTVAQSIGVPPMFLAERATMPSSETR